jgi:hypothetical protein
MATRLSDLSLQTLVKMLKATELAVGSDASSVRVLRRAVVAKRQAARHRRGRKIKL